MKSAHERKILFTSCDASKKKQKKRTSEFFDALPEMNKNRSCVLSKV